MCCNSYPQMRLQKSFYWPARFRPARPLLAQVVRVGARALLGRRGPTRRGEARVVGGRRGEARVVAHLRVQLRRRAWEGAPQQPLRASPQPREAPPPPAPLPSAPSPNLLSVSALRVGLGLGVRGRLGVARGRPPPRTLLSKYSRRLEMRGMCPVGGCRHT